MTIPQPLDAAAAFAPSELGDDTRVTPTIPDGAQQSLASAGVELPASAPAPAAAPSVVPKPGDVDAAGAPFNPAIHEPRARADGRWKLKRGGGARKAKGLPIQMPQGTVMPRAAAPAPTAPPPPRIEAVTIGPDAPPPGALAARLSLPPPADAVDAVPTQQLPREDYDATGRALARALWGCARVILGPAWRPQPAELDEWTSALGDLWHAHQWPRVGPWVQVLTLGVVAVEQRSDDAETRTRWQRFKAWIMGRTLPRNPER